ncbi:MAG TPA: LLM class F420-dependent oxidoreductase [Acidimicrobiales bacterium]|jgi:F420-dependent oxidoreductase-like protein|nr:LLM class F420-dependent oxidoreductase [Acidimicrobiales bacterium]
MRVDIHLMNFAWPDQPASIAATVAATARAAEEAGVSSFSLMDHWFQMENFSRAEDPMLEGYTSLGFIAGHTETVTLGLIVTGVTYRHPGLLAKIVTTLDVLSGGRAQLGIGAAWYEREHAALGVPFPPVAERFERLEETLQICLQMWSDDNGPFEGRHYRLAETLCSPRPLSSPRPPILIGGGGERKTLRLVARYADACNLFAADVDVVAHKLDVLRGHCDAEQRDYADITKTIMAIGNPLDDPDAFVTRMAGYARLGVDTVAVMPAGDPVEFVTELGRRVIPRLDDLEASSSG